MKTSNFFTASALVLAATNTLYSADFFNDFNPGTPVRPSAGMLNDWLRKDDPYMAAWDLGTQVRFRYEIRDNFGIAGAGATSVDFSQNPVAKVDNAYFLHRFKPHVGYTAEWFSAYVEGRGSGSTGDKRNPNPESDGPFDLHQAYVTLGNHKEFPLSVKVGRQELSYGDERLIGSFDWNNIGRVFDAAKLRWQTPYFAADLFSGRVSIPYDNHFNMPNDYDWFSGLYMTSKLIPKQTTDFYVLSRNTSSKSPGVLVPASGAAILRGPSARDIYTVGLRVKSLPLEFGNWDYSAELMGQYGHFNDPGKPAGSDRSLEHQAFAAYVGGGYTWNETAYVPRVGLEYNFATGDSDPTDNKHETFENLFPTNHKFYGYMDLVSLQNIHNVRLMTSVKPLPRLTLQAEGHAFWLADTHDNFYAANGARRGGIGTTPGTGYGINPGYSNFVGSEADLIGTYAIAPYANLQVGYGHFFRGDYIKQSLSAVGSGDANWVYIMTTFNF
ncbi:MAG: hypothetical protein JWM16_1326 [Verrucomicrobiales bacterium]|nr:hypothetical protein [Verrucomicrobiales bacterium]